MGDSILIETQRPMRTATVLSCAAVAALLCTAPRAEVFGDRFPIIQLAQSFAPSKDAIVRAVKRDYPGSKVLSVKRHNKGANSRYRVKVLTADGKVKVINISSGDL